MEMERTTIEEAREFSGLLKGLNEKQQEGLYLMIIGAAVLAGEKKDIFA